MAICSDIWDQTFIVVRTRVCQPWYEISTSRPFRRLLYAISRKMRFALKKSPSPIRKLMFISYRCSGDLFSLIHFTLTWLFRGSHPSKNQPRLFRLSGDFDNSPITPHHIVLISFEQQPWKIKCGIARMLLWEQVTSPLPSSSILHLHKKLVLSLAAVCLFSGWAE